MANPTTNLNMTKPTVGGSTDTWGTTLNEQVIDVIDAIFAIGGTDVTMSDVAFNSVKFQETGTGTDFIAMQAPAAVTTSYTLTMPTAVGSSGQALRASDASGTLEWYTPADVGDITSVVAGAGLTGGGTSGAVTLNAVGTSNRITVNADDIDIASTYVGQTSITTVGALGAGSITSGFGNIDVGSSTIDGGTITADTAFVPDAADGASLGTASLEFSDLYLADGAVIQFGNDQDVSLTHVPDTGLLLGGTRQLQFYDASQRIAAIDDTTLSIGATDEIDITATLIDLNGNVDVSGTIVGASTIQGTTITATTALAGTLSTAAQPNITAVGTIATGVWNGTALATAYIADNAVTLAKLEDGTQGDVLYYAASGAPARLGAGSSGQVLTSGGAGANPSWASPTVGDLTAIVAGAGLTGTSLSGPIPTLNVIGTSGTITVSADAVTIDSTYVGQTSITTLGTIATGTWNGTAITGDYIDVTTSPLANTKIWIGDSSGDAQEFALSGDATMTAGGVVTVTAPAGTLTGTTLKSTVVSSSLTSVGTIATGVWNGTAIATAYIADNAITLAKLEDGTQGDVLYYGASGAPARLGAGSSGQVLTSGGAGANPAWATPTTGDITSVVAGTGLSGGGTSGDVTLNGDAAQTGITSVGALDGGSITSGFGNIDVGSSNIDGATITADTAFVGTLSTAAQANITSLGTLSGLAVSGQVGVGTTSPTSYYTTDLVIADTAAGQRAGITIANASDGMARIDFADGTSGDAQYRGTIAYAHSGNTDGPYMRFVSGNNERMRLTTAQVIMGLPTSDPSVANALWNDSGTVKISAG